MKYDYSVFIGRFQPFHNGHLSTVKKALSQSKNVIILIGSATGARSPKNPFTADERRRMIMAAMKDEGLEERVTCLNLRDFSLADNAWIAEVQQLVSSVTDPGSKICLSGVDKDESSWYLKILKRWPKNLFKISVDISATDVRKVLFEGGGASGISGMVPDAVSRWISSFFMQRPDVLRWLKAECAKYEEDQAEYGLGPHITVDAAITCCGCVLLVERKNHPGKGLWAMPGGFLGRNERLQDGMIRELREETGLKVPAGVLRGGRTPITIDNPTRSLRGRVITHVFPIDLKDDELPKVRAASDAKQAVFKDTNWVLENPHLFFEDHWPILELIIKGGSK